jgi:hypothetical protein
MTTDTEIKRVIKDLDLNQIGNLLTEHYDNDLCRGWSEEMQREELFCHVQSGAIDMIKLIIEQNS